MPEKINPFCVVLNYLLYFPESAENALITWSNVT